MAHRIIDSGLPNFYGERIPLHMNWNILLFRDLLHDYQDIEVTEWLKYGFSVSRSDDFDDPIPCTKNHLGANMYPAEIDRYIITEMQHGATLGPFTIPPFLGRMGVSPLSTRPKRESTKRRIIMDLSFPKGASVNDGISKFTYCGQKIELTYPTIDTLAKRIMELGDNVRLWKKNLVRAFRQVPPVPQGLFAHWIQVAEIAIF